nr:response regulator transcription factor [uncultured Undibacterium sp.]
MTQKNRPTALVAEDEPILRDELVQMLKETWPELEVVIAVRNGRDAVKQFELFKPDICFLDIHMPGLSGIDAARKIGHRAHLVFVTAYDHYAVQAFERGALDYLIKPIEKDRLIDTVRRLKNQLSSITPSENIESILSQLSMKLSEKVSEKLNEQLARQLPSQLPTQSAPPGLGLPQSSPPSKGESLLWIRAQVGQILKLISVEKIDFLRADDKYTLVGWHNDLGEPVEDIIRTPLKDLVIQLDPIRFVQVHRAVLVNLHSISHVVRGDNETATIHLKGHVQTLPISRTYLHHFRGM